jgi:branched-chain amino acid transport system substrate-binding protein
MRTRSRPLWRVLALLFTITVVAAACGDDDDDAADDTTTTEADDTTSSVPENTGDGVLKIGYLLPQTGQLSFLGPPMIQGVKMAIEEINAAGGVLGQPIELVEADDGTDPDVANTAADTLLAEGVDYIVGAAGSSISLAVIDKITGAGVPMCSPSNTGVQFTTYEDRDLYFRTAPPDNLQAQVLADLIVSDGHSNVVVLGRSDEYGEGFANFLADELEALGAEVPEVIIYDPLAGSFQAEAQQIAEHSPDAVAIISYEEAAQVMTAAIAEGVGPEDVQWYGADGIQSSSFWESVDANNPAVVAGVKGTAPTASPAAGEDTFLDRFATFAEGTDTIYAGYAYDCASLAALAATVAGSDAPGDIAGEIIGVSGGGEKCLLVAECIEMIGAGTDVDYDGASGALDFVEAGEPGAGSYDTWQFAEDGSVETIEGDIVVAKDD